MQILVSRAGLVLNPGQVADLVLAWRQVAALIGTMPRGHGFVDDMALSFRLPPPVQVIATPAAARRPTRAVVRPAVKPLAKQPSKSTAKVPARPPVKASVSAAKAKLKPPVKAGVASKSASRPAAAPKRKAAARSTGRAR
jgi:hypothetical protein